jgi:hypothetical protein
VNRAFEGYRRDSYFPRQPDFQDLDCARQAYEKQERDQGKGRSAAVISGLFSAPFFLRGRRRAFFA